MLKRGDYKAIKHMNRQQMSEYLQRIYQRGFQAGMKRDTTHPPTPNVSSDATPGGEVVRDSKEEPGA